MSTPEELIIAMTTEELCELLGEMGFEATDDQAGCIKALVEQMGSLEAALEALSETESVEDVRRAA